MRHIERTLVLAGVLSFAAGCGHDWNSIHPPDAAETTPLIDATIDAFDAPSSTDAMDAQDVTDASDATDVVIDTRQCVPNTHYCTDAGVSVSCGSDGLVNGSFNCHLIYGFGCYAGNGMCQTCEAGTYFCNDAGTSVQCGSSGLPSGYTNCGALTPARVCNHTTGMCQ